MTTYSKIPNWFRGVLFILFVCSPVLSFAGNIQLISALSGQPSVGGNGESYLSVVSPDGRYVLFSSTANNLVPTNSDGPVPGLMASRLNVFLRDRVGGTTTLVSVNPAGGSADEDCEPTGISTNGQFALFESTADNLAAGATNNTIKNLFVRDLINNTTTLASIGLNGVQGNGNSRESTMTPNGRYVVFTSDATNLVANDTNGIPDVFVRDLLNNTTTLASTGAISAGTFPGIVNGSGTPQITSDGRYVAFCSSATNLVHGFTPAGGVYVRDLVAGTTIWASPNLGLLYFLEFSSATTNVTPCNELISTDGHYLAFEVGPTNSSAPGIVLRKNLQTLAVTIVSTNANVPPLQSAGVVDNFNKNISMTSDGSLIAFVANGTASTTNTAIDLWSAQTGTNVLVSADLNTGLPAVGICEEPVIDPSGQYVAYLSSATNIVTNIISTGYHAYLWNAGVTQLADAGTNSVGVGVYPTAICALSSDGSVFFDQSLANASLIPNDINAGSEVLGFHPAGTMELISGCQPTLPSQTPNGFTKLYPSCVSTNGRFIAFVSQAGNLLGSNTLGAPQIFVRDRMLGTNIMVSVDTNGLPATQPSGEPSISGDGRYVVFSSYASNLVAGTTSENVYLRDLQSGTTALVSSNLSAGSGNADSYRPTISSDGRYILFRSKANNLNGASPVQSLGIENLFFHDQLLATNYALTTGSTLTFSIGVLDASMTSDGHHVAYIGSVSGNGVTNTYVWDSQAVQLIYTNTLGSAGFAISPDGSLFATSVPPSLWAYNLAGNTSNLVASGTSYFPVQLQFSADDTSLVFVLSNHIYLHNFLTGTNLLVDRSYSSGDPANGISRLPAISPNGRFVAYYSTSSNIVPNVAAANGNIYLYDWTNNATILASLNLAGNSTANYWSLGPQFSGDGNTLAFQSFASDLSALAFNEFGAVFALDLSSYSGTNSPGTNATFYAQISGLGGAGQNPAGVNPVINWSAAPGSSYQVQYKDDLLDPIWQTVNGNMIFLGNSGQIIDLTPAASQRFYRIVAVP
jgi:Tol biopolymer transport system component